MPKINYPDAEPCPSQLDVSGAGYAEDMEQTMSIENAALYALLQRPDSKWAALRAQLTDHGSPSELLRERLGAHLIRDEFDSALHEAQSEIDAYERDGIHVDTAWSERYPEQLLTVHDYPPVIFWQGHREERDLASVAIVGTREPTDGALRFVRELSVLLAAADVTVVSGLARGIDIAAMRASLEAGNRTVGVIGTGVRKFYPREHRAIQEQIAESHMLISQFKPDSGASQRTFPMRNVVMSAFASMTVIAEAGENSGTRIQANAAVRHGRPLVISRAVYLNTTWGKELVDRGYDVAVVSTAAEAMEAVRRVHARYLRRPSRWTEET